MILSNSFQLNLLVNSILAGIFTGVFFDIYRVIRGEGPKIKVIGFIEDILFWILAAICIFIFMLYKIEAIINLYVFIFVFTGALMYFKLISEKVIKFYRFSISYILKFLRVSFNLCIFPLRILKFIFLKK